MRWHGHVGTVATIPFLGRLEDYDPFSTNVIAGDHVFVFSSVIFRSQWIAYGSIYPVPNA